MCTIATPIENTDVWGHAAQNSRASAAAPCRFYLEAVRPALSELQWQQAAHAGARATTDKSEAHDAGSSRFLGAAIVTGGFVAAAVAATVAFDVDVEDAIFGNGLSTGLLSLGLPGATAAAMWSLSLWFVSPLQLLLLFLGKIETERPSDWLMNGVGTLAGQPVKDLGYEHPLAVRALAVIATFATGCGVAYGLEAGLGDATWGVSSGIASCMAAGVYELGRPTRLSSSEAVQLEEQWQVFAGFARTRLQKGGRCHESEIWRAFEADHPEFRLEENKIPEQFCRDMVANWYPQAQRSAAGFYKNVSLQPRSDPFTGETTGVDLSGASEGAT